MKPSFRPCFFKRYGIILQAVIYQTAMNAQRRFCKVLSIKQIPTSIENTHKVASYCNSAAYTVLPVGILSSRSGLFCAPLLGLMLGFSACGKSGTATNDPTRGGSTAPNQGVSFEIDTNWLGDTVYFPGKS